MYSRPAPTSIGTICPGSFVAKEIDPVPPMARYPVMNNDPPPATRFSTPKSPPPPPNCVCVVSWMELVIQESSPASEMTDSLGSRTNSSTGMVVPTILVCIFVVSWLLDIERKNVLYHGIVSLAAHGLPPQLKTGNGDPTSDRRGGLLFNWETF